MNNKEAISVCKNIVKMDNNSVYANQQYVIKLAPIFLKLNEDHDKLLGDFPKMKYDVATSLVALNQRILDNKGLSAGDLEEMQQLIHAYNY
jgi:hypothetical protein